MTFLKPLYKKNLKANIWLGILLLSACSLQTTTPTPDLPPINSVVPLVTVAETEADVAEASDSPFVEPSLIPSLEASATSFEIGDLEKGINPLTGLAPSDQEAVYMSLIVTAFTWFSVIFILCLLVRLSFRSVALATLPNCLLTCFLLVFICKWLSVFTFAWIIGMLIGVVVGRVLCFLHYVFSKREGLQP